MSSPNIVAFFQTALSLMCSTFPKMIDTDDKKKMISSILDPLLDLVVDNNYELYCISVGGDSCGQPYSETDIWYLERGIEHFKKFLSLLQSHVTTNTISFDTFILKISSAVKLVNFEYYFQFQDFVDSDFDHWYFPTVFDVVEKIMDSDEDCFGEIYFSEFDFEKQKYDLTRQFEKKSFNRINDVERRKRNKGQIKSHRNVRLSKNRKITKPPKNLRFDITV